MQDIGHEQALEEPGSQYITADCGHEVYEDECDDKGRPTNYILEYKNAKGKIKTICPNCFWDLIKGMSISEVAEQFNFGITEVTF